MDSTDSTQIIDESAFEFPIDSDASNTTSIIDSQFPEISVEQLVERANAQITVARSQFKTSTTTAIPQVQNVVVRASREMEAAIDSVIEIPSPIPSDDDDEVIFVAEHNDIVNLCSPDDDRGSKSLVQTNRARNNDRVAAARPIPLAEKENAVLCTVCLESSVGRQPHSTNCGHIYCGKCIKDAIKITKKCPLCNKKLSLKDIFSVFI